MAVYQNLTLTQVSQDGDNNCSKVRILWQSTQTGASYNAIADVGRYTLYVGGQAQFTKEVPFVLPKNTTQVIVDTEEIIFHNDKGDAQITVETWMNTRISAGIVELSQSLKLDNIPQASVATASDAVIGGVSRLAVTRKNAQSTHAIGWKFGTLTGFLTPTGEICSEEVRFAGEKLEFYLPESFYDQIPNAKTGVCELTVYTYCGFNPVGTPQKAQFNVSVQEEACIPEIFGTVTDTNAATVALTGDRETLIRYRSCALCTVAGQAKKGARIVHKKIAGEAVEEGRIVDGPESGNFVLEVTDSRGFTAKALLQAACVPYIPLTCFAEVKREGAASGEATLSISGAFYDGSFGKEENILLLSYSTDGENFIPIQAELGEGTYSAQVKLTDMDYTRRYTVTVRATDCLSTAEKQVILKKGVPTFDWGESDFAFHVPVQMDSDLQVGGSLSVGGKLITDLIYPVGGVYTAGVQTDPGTLLGGVWQQLQTQEEGLYRWMRTR